MSSLSTYQPETHGGTVTSWIPLQTAYPSSSGCESLFWAFVETSLVAWDPGYGISVNTGVKCLPPAATTWWDQDRLGINSLTRVSLGPIVCPIGYTAVTPTIENQSSTFIACCPPNYTFCQLNNVGTTGECSSEVPAGTNISYAIKDRQESWFITSTFHTTATTAWGIPIDGYNIAPQTTSSSTTSTSGISSAGTPPTTSTPPVTDTPQQSPGLSTGAKVGIGVGIGLGVLALGALIVFIFAHRKRKLVVNGGEPTSNLMGNKDGPVPVYEIEGRRETRIHELGDRGMPAELYSSR